MDLEVCICPAILTDKDYPRRGHRHSDCFRTMTSGNLKVKADVRISQGFITSRNRFVTREEGYKLQIAAGIYSVAKDGYRGERLFSEDLY